MTVSHTIMGRDTSSIYKGLMGSRSTLVHLKNITLLELALKHGLMDVYGIT